MNDESDEFRPRLGRMRILGGRASKRYVARLYATVEKMKPGSFAKRSGGRFTGARLGRGAGAGAADDAHERRFLAIEAADGAQWHAPIDSAPGAAPPIGAIVEITCAGAAPRAADRVIAAIADRHGGVYADALHAAADPSASADFRLAHKRRLEALRCAGVVERSAEGAWRIPEDFLERVAAHEGERAMARVRVLSWAALDHLPGAGAVTFLDDALEKRLAIERVPHGFGAELDHALAARRRWLLSQGIGREVGDGFAIDRDRLGALARISLEETAARLARDLGKSHTPPLTGDRIAGVYRRPIDLPAGRFALIERSKEFTLVPWREALEQRRDMEIAGLVRSTGINWEIGRTRGLGR